MPANELNPAIFFVWSIILYNFAKKGNRDATHA